MSVIRVQKTKDYSVISNYHLRDKSLSLKAKGLLSLMLSLPDDWDYSIVGLEKITKEGHGSINYILHELEANNYLVRNRLRNSHGNFNGWEYIVYEIPVLPQSKKPYAENPYTDKPYTENRLQINTNILNTNKQNTKSFKEPTLEEVQSYCKERNNKVDPQTFIDFYQSKGWMVGSNKMKDWKACVRTWERRNPKNQNSIAQKRVVATPEWYGKETTKVEGAVEPINPDEFFK